MSKHRTPPYPETFRTYNGFEHQGLCKWCREPLPQKGEDGYHHARMWHPECAARYNFLSNPEQQRREVLKRDNGICASCGGDFGWRTAGQWCLDHIEPLWKSIGLPDSERMRFFEITNMQTLCVPCHAVKTKAEAAERASLKKVSDETQLGMAI